MAVSALVSKRLLARVGTTVGKYRIEWLLGVGGMAAVYAAREQNQRPVAIKLLLEAHLDDPHIQRLFRRESYVANEIGHPGAVGVLEDDVDDDGCPYLVMPLLEGETLRARWEAAGKRLPVREVGVFMADVLDVLASAHAKRIVHRDIKPENLFVTVTGHVRVLDFGIARRTFGDGSASATGQLLGTPGFMPPEQALGDRDRIGPHSDCWAVGATIFALLSGQQVHKAENAAAQLAAAATRPARSLAEVISGLPASVVRFVDKALAFDPAERWPSAHEMRAALLVAFKDALGRPVSTVAIDVRAEIVRTWSSRKNEYENTTFPPLQARQAGPFFVGSVLHLQDTQGKEAPVAAASKSEPNDDASKSIVSDESVTSDTRLGRVLMSVLTVFVGLGIAAIIRYNMHMRRGVVAAGDETSLAQTPIDALIISPTCKDEARSRYREGLHAFQQARWELAYDIFEKGVAADQNCPEVAVQLALAARETRPLTEVREYYHHAVALRHLLHERDRVVLDAVAPLILFEPADRKESTRRLELALAKFPRDAQLLGLTATAYRSSVSDLPSIEHALELVQRATQIDPQYADAIQVQALLFSYLGRSEEELDAISRCLELVPGSDDCLGHRIRIMRTRGECSEVVLDARKRLASTPTSWGAYTELANGLASQGAAMSEVDEAIQQSWKNNSGARRDVLKLYYRSLLAARNGDFKVAADIALRLLEEIRSSPIMFDHARASALFAEVKNETGEDDAAAAVALKFFREKDAWTDSFWTSNEHEPVLLGTLLQQKTISREQWRRSIDVWAQRTRDSLTRRQLWAFRWGPVTYERELALEAWASAPDEIPSAELWGEQIFYRSLVGMIEGRISLIAGEHARAVELLEVASQGCHDLQLPFMSTRAHLWLGQAKERTGDIAGACSAYAKVLRRWGNAKPRSVTADEARRRVKELRCSP